MLLLDSTPNVPLRGLLNVEGESGASGMDGRARATGADGIVEYVRKISLAGERGSADGDSTEGVTGSRLWPDDCVSTFASSFEAPC